MTTPGTDRAGRTAGRGFALVAELRAELDALDPDDYDDADKILRAYVADLDDIAASAATRRDIPDGDRAAWCAAYVSGATERYRETLRAWEEAG